MRVKKNYIKIALWILLALLLFLICFGLLFLWENKSDTVNNNNTNEEIDGVYFNDKLYTEKENILNVLIIGVDKFQKEIETNAYNNNQQADFLMLLTLDRENKTYSAIHINRDTMAKIPVLGLNNEDAGTIDGQLALSHTYGDGGKSSCSNTVYAVSDFLYKTKIDHYLKITMDAVPKLNDAVGGVTLRLLDDFSKSFPQMIKGNTVKLSGDMALEYVRGRSGLENNTNISRMERQRQYIESFRKTMESKNDNEELLANILNNISNYTLSDCTGQELLQIYKDCSNYEYLGITTIEGTSKVGNEFMEFYVDEEKLKNLVVQKFYNLYEK